MIERSSSLPRKSSAIFGNLRKVVGNLRKNVKNAVLSMNITRYLEDIHFMFSWQEQYLTRSLRSLVRYCSCHENIKFLSSSHRVISSRQSIYMCCIAIETSSVLLRNLRSSSEIYRNLPKFSENVRKCLSGLRRTFGKSLEMFGKCAEIFGKSSKISSSVCLYNKHNNTWLLVDMEFLFSCSTLYLTSERSEGVRYQFEHSKRNCIHFVCRRTHALSSIY